MTTTQSRIALWLSALLFALMSPMAALAAAGDETEPPRTVEDEVREIIKGQLLAFQAGDGPGAFFFAAPQIQAAFGGPEQFMVMVESGYNAIFANTSFEFGDTLIDGSRAMQEVIVSSPDEQNVVHAYFLGRRGDVWKIEGVQRLRGGPNS